MNMSTASEKLSKFFGLSESEEMDFETSEMRSGEQVTNSYVNPNKSTINPNEVSNNSKQHQQTKESRFPQSNKIKTEKPSKKEVKKASQVNKTSQSNVENVRVSPNTGTTQPTKNKQRTQGLEESLVNKVSILEPRTYTESKEIAKCIFRNEIAIVNFHLVDENQARRIVDFLTGTVYALDGDIQRLGGELFICTPPNTEIDSATAKSLLQTQFNGY